MRNEVDSGVEHGEVLLRFADAAVGRAPDLAEAREAVNAAMGAHGVIDSAAVIANFQRMVRIADGCGIPLDATTEKASEPWRDTLGVNSYRSRSNTFG
ncbi:MAG: hypothetical protein OXD50_02640 [Chloroflexi bacterium]|nr:hypothetical protein [Chloroflexota bacterium]